MLYRHHTPLNGPRRASQPHRRIYRARTGGCRVELNVSRMAWENRARGDVLLP